MWRKAWNPGTCGSLGWFLVDEVAGKWRGCEQRQREELGGQKSLGHNCRIRGFSTILEGKPWKK